MPLWKVHFGRRPRVSQLPSNEMLRRERTQVPLASTKPMSANFRSFGRPSAPTLPIRPKGPSAQSQWQLSMEIIPLDLQRGTETKCLPAEKFLLLAQGGHHSRLPRRPLSGEHRSPPATKLTRIRRRRSNCFALRDFLFDHLVGAQQNRLRHGKTERFGGLEVHDHLEFGWQLNG
jgi:hypothetical protein